MVSEQPPVKLPFWRTVIDAHVLTFQNLGALVRIGWPWALLLVATSAALNWAIWPYEEAAREAGEFGTYGTFLPVLSSMLIGALVAVPWHRLILTNTELPPAQAGAYLKPALRYFLWLVALAALAALPVWLLWTSGLGSGLFSGMAGDASAGEAAVPQAAGAGAAAEEELPPLGATDHAIFAAIALAVVLGPLAVLSFVPTRLSLILPAIALQADAFTASDSWQATRGNFWRLYLGSFAVMALMMLLFAIYLTLMGAEMAATQAAFVREAVILDAVSFAAGMVLVTFLSLSYRHLVMKEAPRAFAGASLILFPRGVLPCGRGDWRGVLRSRCRESSPHGLREVPTQPRRTVSRGADAAHGARRKEDDASGVGGRGGVP